MRAYFGFLSFVYGCFVVVVFPIEARSLSIVCCMTKGEEEKKLFHVECPVQMILFLFLYKVRNGL